MDFFGGGSEQSRFSQLTQQTQNLHNQRTQQPQLQNSLHPTDSLNHPVYANSLSKFFDFHKNQQQQQQQQQFVSPQQQQQQQQLFMSDQMNVSNLMDQSRLMDARRLNSQFMDQQNSSNSKCLLYNILTKINRVENSDFIIFACNCRFAWKSTSKTAIGKYSIGTEHTSSSTAMFEQLESISHE